MNIEAEAYRVGVSLRRARPIGVVSRVAARVADGAGLSVTELMGDSRKRHIAHARQAVYALCADAGLSVADIGRAIGRDHTTIIHGIAAHKRRMEAGQ